LLNSIRGLESGRHYSRGTCQLPEQISPNAQKRRPPVVVALVAQLAAGVLCVALAALLKRSGLASPQWPLVLAAQGIVAAVLSQRWGLARWWLPLQMVMPMAAAAALALGLPSWVYLLGFAALALVFWNAAGDRVPLYLSNRTTWQALFELLPETPGGRFLDIGAGLGGTLVYLGKKRPDMRVVGIESAPLPFAICWLRIKLASLSNVSLRYGDLWKIDLSAYDMVYAFLSPEPMPALFDKVKTEMPPGSTFVSNSFVVPGEDPTETRSLDDSRQTTLLIWRR